MFESITTISYDQEEIIRNIIKLYCPNGIECDPTYSRGIFYKNIHKPKFKFDLDPQRDDVIKADCRNLPLIKSSLTSIMFDPPFIAGGVKKGKLGVIKSRFGYYKSIVELWKLYEDSFREFKRILIPKGVLIFKCQDTIQDHKQYLSHLKILNLALECDFYPKDLFVLLAKNRLIRDNLHRQQHARKYHSYFLVFINQKSLVKY